MNPEGEREDLETTAEASSAVISWDEGGRVVGHARTVAICWN